MGSLLLRWVLNTLALFIVAQIVPGIEYNSFVALAIAAAVLGLLNAVVKPILFWLTLPLTILTLGLFLLVLNGLMLWMTSLLVPGFLVSGAWHAIVAAFLLAIISLVTNRIGREERR